MPLSFLRYATCCGKVAGYARAWARTSDLGRKTMAGGVCYLTTHTPATSSFVPDLPASATSSPRPPDIACLFPESVALGQDARPRSGVRPRSCPRPRCVPRTAVAAWFKPSCQGDLLSGQVRGVAWLALLRGGASESRCVAARRGVRRRSDRSLPRRSPLGGRCPRELWRSATSPLSS